MNKKPIILNSFLGGLTSMPYENVGQGTFQTAKNLEVFKYNNLLTPISKLAETSSASSINSDSLMHMFLASTGTLFGFGANGTKLRIDTLTIPQLSPSNLADSASNATAPAIEDGSGNLYPLACAELAGYLLFWEGTSLSRILLSGPTFQTNPYTFTVTNRGPIFTHEGLGKAFIAVDKVKVYSLASADVSGSSDPTLRLTLDAKYEIRSFCEYGRFLLIGAQAVKDSTTSKIFVYDGNSTTVEDIIDVGDVGLQSIRNVNGLIHILCCKVTISDPENYTRIYLWGGGQLVLAKEISMSSIAPTAISGADGTSLPYMISDSSVTVSQDKLWWSYKGYTNAQYLGILGITNGVYSYGMNKFTGRRILTHYATPTVSMADHNGGCIKIIRNNLYFAYSGLESGTLKYRIENTMCTLVSTVLTPGFKSSSGVYQSNIFPIGYQGKIQSILINHHTLPASCGFTVSIKHFGVYPRGSTVPAEDSFTAFTTTNGAPQGSGSSTGKTQSTDNTTYTLIESPNVFKKANYAQLQIELDETSGINAPSIVFPIIINLE